MIQSLLQEISSRGDKAQVVPIARLADIKKDLQIFEQTSNLNNHQRSLVQKTLQFTLPETPTPIQSIILVAARAPEAQADVTFQYQGRAITRTLPVSSSHVTYNPLAYKQFIPDFVATNGYHATFVPQLPRKRLCVQSGLGTYGRNNIAYIDGLGSSVILLSFLSDIPCQKDTWQDVRLMDSCAHCHICVDQCPTGALSREAFLINTERCLTQYNSYTPDLPSWIPPTAHNCLDECAKCTATCPQNIKYALPKEPPFSFTEEETQLCLQGKSLEEMPPALVAKIKKLNMDHAMDIFPRNLQLLLTPAL